MSTDRETLRERVAALLGPGSTPNLTTHASQRVADAVLSVVDEETERLTERLRATWPASYNEVKAERDALKAENERQRASLARVRALCDEALPLLTHSLGVVMAVPVHRLTAALDTPEGDL